jgi:hypothetical protein
MNFDINIGLMKRKQLLRIRKDFEQRISDNEGQITTIRECVYEEEISRYTISQRLQSYKKAVADYKRFIHEINEKLCQQ